MFSDVLIGIDAYERDIGTPEPLRMGTDKASCLSAVRLPQSLIGLPFWGIILTLGEEKKPPRFTVMP